MAGDLSRLLNFYALVSSSIKCEKNHRFYLKDVVMKILKDLEEYPALHICFKNKNNNNHNNNKKPFTATKWLGKN